MLPSHPVVEGPFARSVREALESVLSQAASVLLMAEALRFGDLDGIPEDVAAFRAFCEGPFRRAVRANVAQAGIEQIFERLGHVLWMATSDVSVVEAARTWSQPGPNDRDGDSGVRNVEIGLSGARADEQRSDSQPRSSAHASDPGAPSGPPSGATLGRMRAISRAMPAAMPDPRSARGLAPSTVLVVSLDGHLVSQVRQGLAQHAPVRAIGAASELVGSLVTSGERLVVLIDTALPSIAVSTFAGLIPVLPAGTRVVLWGANKRQLSRLNEIYPATLGWSVSEDAEDPAALLLTLT